MARGWHRAGSHRFCAPPLLASRNRIDRIEQTFTQRQGSPQRSHGSDPRNRSREHVMTHITSHRRSGKLWRSIMAAIATAAMRCRREPQPMRPTRRHRTSNHRVRKPSRRMELREHRGRRPRSGQQRRLQQRNGPTHRRRHLHHRRPRRRIRQRTALRRGRVQLHENQPVRQHRSGNASFAMWYRYDTTLDPTGDKPAVLLQQDGARAAPLLTLRPSNQYHTYVNATDVLSNNTVARGDGSISPFPSTRRATRSSSMSTARSTAKRTWEPRPSTPSPRCWSARTRTSAPWTRIR